MWDQLDLFQPLNQRLCKYAFNVTTKSHKDNLCQPYLKNIKTLVHILKLSCEPIVKLINTLDSSNN